MPPLRICQVTAELAPYAKTGGLGDAVAGLARMLGGAGADVRVFLPLYAPIPRQGVEMSPVEFIHDVPVAMGGREIRFSAYVTRLPASAVDVYLIHCPALYHQDAVYAAGWDEHLRFGLLARAALECCQRMSWAPDIVHCHDWHAALAPLYLKSVYGWDRLFADTRSVLSLHNLGFHGIFGGHTVGELALAPHAGLLFQDDLAADRLSFLKTGILHADVLATVSETYAREILTPEHGFGLDTLLRARTDHLFGIVNGVDYGEWSPESDPHLPHRYSRDDLSGKRKMKTELLARTGLRGDERTPVLGMVTRLTPQKGIDLCLEVLPALLASRDVRVVILGSGEARFEEFFLRLQTAFPGKAWYFRGYNEPLAHWIEAGADLFLMPSLYEPCGLNQMYSLRYGTAPVVRKTGGLADTVELYDWQRGTGTGFVFEHFTAAGLSWAIDCALRTFDHPLAWRGLQERGMAQDFSWDVQGQRYLELFARICGR